MANPTSSPSVMDVNSENPQVNRLIETIQTLEAASSFQRSEAKRNLISIIDQYARKEDLIHILYEYSDRLDRGGVFKETVWKDPSSLVPTLVKGTLGGGFEIGNLEILSELRLLRYATGDAESTKITAEEAVSFLQEVVVKNLDLVFTDSSEELRVTFSDSDLRKIRNLFDLILEKLSLQKIKYKLAEEVEQIAHQRPILTNRLEGILKLVLEKIELSPVDSAEDERLHQFITAYKYPTEGSRERETVTEYGTWLHRISNDRLQKECKEAGQKMRETGLVSPYTVALLQHISPREPKLVSTLLQLDKHGRAEYERHREFIEELIENGVSQAFRQSVLGLALTLERSLLSREAVLNALSSLIKVPLHENIKSWLGRHQAHQDPNRKRLLVGGMLCILGQPLGIGQGLNPTCQSARGISMWSQHAPAKLINMVRNAAGYNNLEFRYENELIQSNLLVEKVPTNFDFKLDPVSIVLVPHLDKIYNVMMQKAALKHPGIEPHQSVNPAFYGYWIQTGFASAYDPMFNAIKQYDNFVRTFYASFHPEYNGDHSMVYPNPVGIIITSSRAEMLGFHAVSMLRVDKDQDGQWRIYFLNPNNEGRQDWGQEIKVSVCGYGEHPGESSLPFHQFLSRLYAFHYNSLSLGTLPDEVPSKEIARVRELAEESWGKKYLWI